MIMLCETCRSHADDPEYVCERCRHNLRVESDQAAEIKRLQDGCSNWAVLCETQGKLIDRLREQQEDCDVSPWDRAELEWWSIVGMHHYRFHGERMLFVAMANGNRCIQAQGPHAKHVWDYLARQATGDG